MEKQIPIISFPQQAIRAKCSHPSGAFVEFKKGDIERSIPDRFEQQVARYPDQIAVKTKHHKLTYEMLNQTANRVAHAILRERDGRDEPIALLMENDAPMMAAILGVLKAGKTYVPLDPSYPRARISYMLEDSQTTLIVTNDKNSSLATELAQNGRKWINTNELDSNLSTENLGLSLSPDTLAYIVYTSGSTGRPKGIVQNHRNVLHDLMGFTNALCISAYDRLSLLHSCSFSAARLDIFGALLNGASLFPFDLNQEGMANLANWLVQEAITIYHWIPTASRHFLSTLTRDEAFLKVRLMVLGSEPVYKRDLDLYKEYFPESCLFVNRLGAGETLIFRMYFASHQTQITGSNVPVGYAIEDKEILLWDEAGAEVGFNEVGEIAVKSRYLSPGYWRRPDLTRAAFLPDSEGEDKRIYRTGDMGYMLPDGCLVHLGRKDFQVKIRGYRIEVAEIEMALMALENIKEAAVVSRRGESEQEENYLVAYIVPVEKLSLSITMLRRALGEKLPDYMVPSAFVFLDALPLTATGKVDRRALPAPDQNRPELDSPFTAPRTPADEALAKIWAEVLALDQVGIHDNFFDLGGNSLLATRIISRVREAFHIELPLRALFEKPTIEELAKLITYIRAEKAPPEQMARFLDGAESLSDEEARELLVGGETENIKGAKN